MNCTRLHCARRQVAQLRGLVNCLKRQDLTRAQARLAGASIHSGASLPSGWVRSESGIITRTP